MTASMTTSSPLPRTRRRSRTSWKTVATPLKEWLTLIQSSSGTLSEESIRVLDVGMKRSITLRDLLIISLLGDEECRNPEHIRTIFDNPYAPSSVQIIRNNLEEAFAHATDMEIRSRCNRGLAILEHAAGHIDNPKGASLLAIITYVKWWMGDHSAYIWAQACLKCDPSCTLASIILSALEHDMFPAQSKD
ncbi:hypothetical protein [Bifidobacterium aquikefiri]|uniref:hypothetical protein n=1 Tax=Bifidobacterium aquikefiri TaxID=1653207 RepID=UPI0039EB4B85